MKPAPFLYNATVIEVTDGDTIVFRVDRGMRDYSTWSVRLLGINCHEVRTAAGKAAKAALQQIMPVGAGAVLATVKPDKYGGRVTAVVLTDHGDLSEYLIAEGWAARWNGRGAAPLPEWPRPERVG